MEKLLLVRFGDLMLKGDNKKMFLDKVNNTIREKLKGLNVRINKTHDRVFLEFDETVTADVLKQLSYISGLHSFSFVYKTTDNLDNIIRLSVELIKDTIKNKVTFKIETKRANKEYKYTSQEISKMIAPGILKQTDGLLTVDVKNPEVILNVEVRKEASYIYVSSIKGMGGFPMGTGGKGLLMVSGGIDSPVAAYLSMKHGIEIELLHFESTPLTPLESVQKVIDLAKILANYMPKNQIRLHLVPFMEIHSEILKNIPDPYIITILRRHMYRIGERFAKNIKSLCLINGESVGQVASQTLDSIRVVEDVTRIPVLRPLITYDKQDIVNIARNIDTYDISIRPFNDCCSIYVPKHPVTHPKVHFAEEYEKHFDYASLIDRAIENIITINIKTDMDFNITDYGFEVKEAIDNCSGIKND